MWGIRVIVPQKYQTKVLNQLHMEHPGITRMKATARTELCVVARHGCQH